MYSLVVALTLANTPVYETSFVLEFPTKQECIKAGYQMTTFWNSYRGQRRYFIYCEGEGKTKVWKKYSEAK